MCAHPFKMEFLLLLKMVPWDSFVCKRLIIVVEENGDDLKLQFSCCFRLFCLLIQIKRWMKTYLSSWEKDEKKIFALRSFLFGLFVEKNVSLVCNWFPRSQRQKCTKNKNEYYLKRDFNKNKLVFKEKMKALLLFMKVF